MANSLNGLDLFASVVEAGSFAQAAERLHLTRSAVGKGLPGSSSVSASSCFTAPPAARA